MTSATSSLATTTLPTCCYRATKCASSATTTFIVVQNKHDIYLKEDDIGHEQKKYIFLP